METSTLTPSRTLASTPTHPPSATSTLSSIPQFRLPSPDEIRVLLDFVLSTNVNAIDEVRIVTGGVAQTFEQSSVDDLSGLFDTGYYLLTGLTPREEGWVPRVFSDGDYLRLVDAEFNADPEVRRFTAFCCVPSDDGLELIINGGKPLPTVLASLAHEAGHARQRVINRSQGRAGRDTNIGAIREAEAFAFQAALVRALGEYSGVNATQVPIRSTANQFFDTWRTNWRDRFDDLTLEHERGALILWLAALHDPLLSQAKVELESQHILSPQSLLAIHERLIELRPDEVDFYIADLRTHFDDDFNFIGGTLDRRKGSVPLEGFVKHVPVIFVIP